MLPVIGRGINYFRESITTFVFRLLRQRIFFIFFKIPVHDCHILLKYNKTKSYNVLYDLKNSLIVDMTILY